MGNVPYEFSKRSWAYYEYVVQIEPLGRIYVLDPDQDIPARSFPPQPEGFPLVPKKKFVDR
jgi:hypothetical protein